jgi:hypothetical protein
VPWTDSILDSEYQMKDPIDTYPSDRMIAMSCPHAFGVKIDHLGPMNPDWATMHDAGMGYNGGVLNGPDFRHFGISRDDVEYVPYWRNGKIVKSIGQGMITSIWKRRGGAILEVMNYGPDAVGGEKTRPCAITLDLRALGVPAGIQGGHHLRTLPGTLQVVQGPALLAHQALERSGEAAHAGGCDARPAKRHAGRLRRLLPRRPLHPGHLGRSAGPR